MGDRIFFVFLKIRKMKKGKKINKAEKKTLPPPNKKEEKKNSPPPCMWEGGDCRCGITAAAMCADGTRFDANKTT
jgi:hypothetical protein